jgi:signal transduction histidine kinase
MVVDDEPRDRILLKEVLEDDGYQVVECEDGLEALDQIRALSPDVILLDVMIPGLNGVEVCRELSQDPRTVAIPVLLVTSQRDREDRLEGISAGARDFISKPVDLADLKVRVRNAAHMKSLYDQSEDRYSRILELEGLRDSLVHMVVHDLKSPLTLIRGNLDLLGIIVGDGLEPDGREALDMCTDGADQMKRMVNSLLDLNKLEAGGLELDCRETRLLEVIEEARSSLGNAGFRRVCLKRSDRVGPDTAECDRGLVKRVAVNLLSNALEYTPVEDPVWVKLIPRTSSVRIEVEDRGPGIPESYREKIFDKFFQLEGTRGARKDSTGLGLAFCKLAVEAHGGQIGVTQAKSGGSLFWFELPRSQPVSSGALTVEGARAPRTPPVIPRR